MKNVFISILVLGTLVLTSCKTMYEVLANTKFNPDLAEQELQRASEEETLVYPFTLNHEANYGCPVVNYEIDGKSMLLMVDTGAPSSYISNKGLKKLGYNVRDFQVNEVLPVYVKWYDDPAVTEKYKRGTEKDIEELRVRMCKDFSYGFYVTFTDNLGNQWSYGSNNGSELDGILGQSTLEKFGRVTFDFKNNLMILNGDLTDGKAVPMKKNNLGHYFIEFNYKEKKEVGLIDTGNYTFSPRNNLGKKDPELSFNESLDFNMTYDSIKNYKIKRKAPVVHTFNNIEVCGVEINNIKGVYSTILFSSYSKGAQILLQYYSGLGCEIFRNHIIQFDYENMEFRFK